MNPCQAVCRICVTGTCKAIPVRFWLLLPLSLITVGWFSGIAAAQLNPAANESTSARAEPLPPGQVVTLFDGATMNGWSKRDGSPHPGWEVHEGTLQRVAGGGDLYYQYPVRDFMLWFDWKVAPGGNSGLKYRVRNYDGSWLGCEYQLLDDAAHGDANKSAGLYDVIDPLPGKPVAGPDRWHHSRIVVCGDHIEHWLDGVKTVDVTVGSPQWKAAVAESKFSDRSGFGENREGRLFLQDHGDPVAFRNLVLLPMDCGPDHSFAAGTQAGNAGADIGRWAQAYDASAWPLKCSRLRLQRFRAPSPCGRRWLWRPGLRR